MRAGGCTVQQALTQEAASVVKQAVSLARRRGHAQVTPLHVANTMLSCPTGLLRAACLQSHSHPLQCKALELCFNVALNRLPTSTTSGTILGSHHYHHYHPPSLSNALVAAFKRAQAHQRRGSIDGQQQALLAVKIEMEQLIISILDDPSVSRVMREAGFSSTQVKTNVEQAVSLDICASTNPNPSSSKIKDGNSIKARPLDQARTEDVMSVIDSLLGRTKRSVVVVGECLTTIEGVVRGVMNRVEKGEVPEVLRNLQFITLPLYSFRLMSRDEVDQKVGELRCFVKSCIGGRGSGVVLYMGDLKWTAENRLNCGEKGKSYYCPVEHVIMEIRSMVCGGMGGGLWLMGIATYQTYMRCRIGNPSLEAVWGFHPLAVPAGSLELSLNWDSDSQSRFKSKRSDGPHWSLLEDGVQNLLNCCGDCSVMFEAEASQLPNIWSSSHDSITSSLPPWLRQYKEESKRENNSDQDCIQYLCKKWSSICHSTHKQQDDPSEMTPHFSSASPSSSSITSYNQHISTLHQNHKSWSVGFEANSSLYLQEHTGQRWPALPCTNPNTSPNPNPNRNSSSSDTMEMEHLNKFKELNAENLKALCNAMERKVPWQSSIIPEIACTILRCRSGMVRSKERSRLAGNKEETWLFFLGGDVDGKVKIAMELSSLIFGSHPSFVSIGLSTFMSTRSGSTDELRNKRSRSEASHSYLERFADAIGDNPHRVFFLEDIGQVDSHTEMGIKNAMKRGRIQSSDGEELDICDAIVILCCESFDSSSRACSPPIKQKSEREEDGEKEMSSSCVCLDLNLSAGDGYMEGCCFDGAGLLETVDRAFFFKLPEDL